MPNVVADTPAAEVEAQMEHLKHLSAEQADIAHDWLQKGFNLAVADAAALNFHKYTDHERMIDSAMADGRELQWQQLVATAIGAGEWARGDWEKRHHDLLVANDGALAAALANI